LVKGRGPSVSHEERPKIYVYYLIRRKESRAKTIPCGIVCKKLSAILHLVPLNHVSPPYPVNKRDPLKPAANETTPV
jgi:hypothetical protein